MKPGFFVAPGLLEKERKSAWYFVIYGTILFFVGVFFCYFVALPFGVSFLLSYQSDFLSPMISVGSYVSFALVFMLAFGVIFNLPLVIVLLTRFGIVTPQVLRKNRRYAMLVMFIAGAVLTPPDIFSQVMMALPLILLYEVSVALSAYFAGKN
jgi:sec-independent protein translocase protein TatC